MKRWAFLVVGLYGLILVVLTLPVILLAFAGQVHVREAFDAYGVWQYWLWISVMMLGQAALLAVPVSLANRRPVARRSLLLPVSAAGLMMGCMAAGAAYASYEFNFQDRSFDGPKVWGMEWPWWSGVAVAMLVWTGWSVMFYRLSRNHLPQDVVSRQCKLLLKGSILELLVAVPTHLVARHRDYCCAGFMTFLGIVFGISVMLFSFGPAVFFLFVERWKRLHPARPGEPEVSPETL